MPVRLCVLLRLCVNIISLRLCILLRRCVLTRQCVLTRLKLQLLTRLKLQLLTRLQLQLLTRLKLQLLTRLQLQLLTRLKLRHNHVLHWGWPAPLSGLLAGLWEFPSSDMDASASGSAPSDILQQLRSDHGVHVSCAESKTELGEVTSLVEWFHTFITIYLGDLHFGRAEVLRSLRHYLLAQS